MTVQYQGVWSLQSAAQLQSTQRWVTDPLFDYTTLLLQADDAANGAQNNTFLDSSSNSFAITRNGNTTQGTFTPFSSQPGAWGNFFDGSGDYLTAAYNTTNFDWFTSGTDFTLEAWVYPTSFTGWSYTAGTEYPTLVGNNVFNSQTNYWSFGPLSNGTVRLIYFTGGTSFVTSTQTCNLNQWNHIAFTKTSSGIAIFVNGVGTTATAISGTPQSSTGTALTVGAGNSAYINGYVSNLRIVKGTAVYSGTTYTVPTAPLTAITNTSLLTCQSNRFVDNSTNAYAITVNGNPSIQAFSPFAPQFQWTPSVIGGSGYFDGTTDFLSVATNAALTVTGNVDACFEAWIYPTATPGGTATILQKSGISGSVFSNYEFGFSSSRLLVLFGGNSGSPGSSVFTLNGATTLPLNAWSHVVGTKRYVGGGSVNEYRVFVNGKLDGFTTAANISDGNAQAFTVGALPSGTAFTGYISGSRVFNTSIPASYQTTSTTVGTQIFTSPTAPATAGTASILCNFTNAGIVDGTMKNNLETVGNAQISTAVVKYGSGSLAFDGSGDYLSLPVQRTIELGSSDWTFESWVYMNAVSSQQSIIYLNGNTSGYAALNLQVQSGALNLWLSASGGAWSLQQNTIGTIAANAWNHIAVVKIGTNIRVYINGTNVSGNGYTVAASLMTTYTVNQIGVYNASSYNLNGYLDDMRLTLGIARYTQNFIPPSVALPRQ